MKGYDVYKRVLNLLGYINNDDSITSDNALYKRGFHIINQILVDLKQEEISDMNCEINLSSPLREALIYGVAMMMSLVGGDGERNRFFTELYNAKRTASLSETVVIGDVIPKVDGGVI